MITQPNLYFYRPTKKNPSYTLHRIVYADMQWTIPDTLQAQALYKYQKFDYKNIALLTLITGDSSKTFTLNNWYTRHKRKNRCEYASILIHKKHTPLKELCAQYVLVPYHTHASWYTADSSGWTRESTLAVETGSLIIPRVILARTIKQTLYTHLEKMITNIKNKAKLCLITEEPREPEPAQKESGESSDNC